MRYNYRAMTRLAAFPLIEEFFAFVGQLALLFWESAGHILRGAVSYRHTLRQMAEVGVGSLLVAIITVGFSGAVAALYVSAQLVKLGQTGFVGGLIGKSIALEIAPVITAIVVSARSGSAMAAELGSMEVTEQVDALRSMGVSPTRYLVVPRVLATLVMLPLVTVLANAAGVLGGAITSVGNGVSSAVYWSSFQSMTTVGDQMQGLVKTIPFALLIALIACRQGLTTSGGARGVGRATTSAVVFAMIAIYIADLFLSLILQNSISF